MSIGYLQLLGIFGTLSARHPVESQLAVQTYQLWTPHIPEINLAVAQFRDSTKQANSPMDQIGVVLELARIHPSIATLLVATLHIWKDHIPALVSMIQELQASANQSA